MIIDWQRLADAEAHYTSAGYRPTHVPWIVSRKAYRETAPGDKLHMQTVGGYLVGSAEQSFIQLLLDGRSPGKSQALTPCFRWEEEYDDLHHPYFMKLELFSPHFAKYDLNTMINDAIAFFDRYTSPVVTPTDIGYDLTDLRTGIELGSYGVREASGRRFVYGTGLAEPRLSEVLRRPS